MIDLITPIAKLKETLEKVQLNDQNTAIYERLKSIIPILESRVNGVGALVCNPSYLNNINSYLASIQNYVNSDISSPTSGYFNNIPGQIDNIISQLMYIPEANKLETKQSLNQIINTYKQQNENIITQVNSEKKSLEKEVLTLKQQIDELKAQINTKEQELTTLSDSFKKQFTDAEKSRSNAFSVTQRDIRNGIILLEIKNRKLSSLNIEEISRKIKETMQYLYEYETELFRPYNTKFFLVLPPDKYKLTSNSNGHFCKEMQSFSSYLVKLILRAFNDKNYPIKIEGQQYVLKSKIILCQNTDRFCI